MGIESILKSITDAAQGAVDKAKKPDDNKKKKPPWLQEDEMGKAQQGKIKSVAERLLSIGNKMAEAGKPPDAATVRTLRGIMNELGAAIERYPSPKAMKSVDMTLEKFQEHAEAEVAKAMEDGDIDRAELLASNIESIGKQVEFFPRAETLKVSVFADPGQQSTTETERPAAGMKSGPDVGVMGAFAKTVERFSEVVEALKAKKPLDEEDEKYPKGKSGDGGTAKAKPKDEKDEEKKKEKDKEKEKEKEKKGDVSKSDGEVVWPLDMNKGREPSESEAWGKVKKGEQSYRDFGPDPSGCRE